VYQRGIMWSSGKRERGDGGTIINSGPLAVLWLEGSGVWLSTCIVQLQGDNTGIVCNGLQILSRQSPGY